MASAISTRNSPDGLHENSDEIETPPLSSPICECQNQLAHWDWAGRPRPNLPKCCQPSKEMLTFLQTGADVGKISVQLLKQWLIYSPGSVTGTATEDGASLTTLSDTEGERNIDMSI